MGAATAGDRAVWVRADVQLSSSYAWRPQGRTHTVPTPNLNRTITITLTRTLILGVEALLHSPRGLGRAWSPPGRRSWASPYPPQTRRACCGCAGTGSSTGPPRSSTGRRLLSQPEFRCPNHYPSPTSSHPCTRTHLGSESSR